MQYFEYLDLFFTDVSEDERILIDYYVRFGFEKVSVYNMNGSFIFFLLIAIIIIIILQVLWETDIAVSLFHRPLVSFFRFA